MNEKIYHQVDRVTGEILRSTVGRWERNLYDYVPEKDEDIAFFVGWRKTWSHVNPLLSELKLYRRWKNACREFKTIGDRPELQRKALLGEPPSSCFQVPSLNVNTGI